MTDEQWSRLVSVVNGERVAPAPVGFIIDSPWLPGWFGISTLDYYADGRAWLDANLKAIDTFPEAIFLPGFWSEYGMCTEPSAFGAKCTWSECALPHAHRTITEPALVAATPKPDVACDGLLPFVIQRLRWAEPELKARGHRIRFAVSRGPLNIASFLMGTTEFMMALYTDEDACRALLETITAFIVDWLAYQREQFPSIDAVLILDDIVGFIGEDDYMRFAHPYLKRIFEACPVAVKAFHNDARGLVCAPHLAALGVNLFNFSFEHGLDDMRRLCGPSVALLGNLPPRDVLASLPPAGVRAAAASMARGVGDRRGVLFSCGGGMPQGVTTEQVRAFIDGIGDAQ